MRRLFKITATLGFSNSLTFVSSLFKNKLIAVFLGTTGMGIISQLNGFLSLLSNLGTLGMQQGVTKFSAACMLKDNDTRIDSEDILSIALFLVGSITMALLLFAVVFNKAISFLIFSDSSYGSWIVIVAVSLPFIAFATIFDYYFKGVGNIKLLFKASILSSLIGVVIAFFLIFFMRIKGAVLQIFTTAFISCLTFYLFYYFLPEKRRGKLNIFNILNLPHAKSAIKELFKHGSVIYISNALLPLSFLIIRGLIIKNFGFDENGIFQSIMLISAIFISFPSEALWAGYFPDISRDRDTESQKKKLIGFMNFFALIAIPAITFVVLFQRFFINLLFSSHFMPATLYLPVRLLGDFIYMMGSATGLIFFANSFFKEVLFFSVLWNFLLVVFSVMLMKLLGFNGIFIAYVLTCLVILIFQSVVLRKRVRIIIGNKELFRIFLSIISVSVICLIAVKGLPAYLYFLPLAVWFCLFFKKIRTVLLNRNRFNIASLFEV